MTRDFLAKKSIESLRQEVSESGSLSLERSLGLVTLISLGVGAIIGAGIFVITGQVAANHAGPAIVVSFLLAALGCVLVGLCYAEFASLIPVAGSAYTYAYATLGELFAWMIGWDLILEYLFSASTVAVGWSGYVISFLKDCGITIPAILFAPGCNVVAMVLVALMTGLLVVGVRQSTQFNNIVVAVKVIAILLFIIFGITCINQQNWLPFIPKNTGEFGVFGWSGILRGSGIVFFAYIGFDALVSLAQETERPQRDIPIAIFIALFISTILYICISLVLTGVVPYNQLNVPDPIALGVNAMGIRFVWLRPVIKIAAIAGLSSVVLVSLMAQSRIIYRMAKDGLLPDVLAKLHPQFKTPYVATIILGIFSMLAAGLLSIEVLSELVSIGTLLAFFVVSIAVLVLRLTQPDLHRPFRTPFVPWIPLLGALISGGQMLSFSLNNWLRLLGWLLIGILIYFAYGRNKSVVRLESQQENKEVGA
ncbi:MAG: amino acid permease [Calothrix sp. C42_A2020_038]|nr:amino acid permease [Calothrix sp. C42_A2020_038]